jgi:hypothetical protein
LEPVGKGLIKNEPTLDSKRSAAYESLPLNLPNLHNLYMRYNNLTDLIGIGILSNNTTIYSKWFDFTMNRIRFIPS